jgi:acetoacetate decarboxylase
METEDLVQNAFAMPLISPSFPRGPYRYSNREHLTITYHTDRAELVS